MRDFWRDRCEKHGHTGWSDPVVYTYDQLERIAHVRRRVSDLVRGADTALDFGCGSGDFSHLLLDYGLQVWGYDPYVTPDINGQCFTFLPGISQVASAPVQFDLILSITVLDHILDEQELLDVLRLMRCKISADGALLLMEYALDNRSQREPNDYQAFRLLDTWQRILQKSGWAVIDIQPVPTPLDCPSPGYHAFQRSLLARILRRISLTRGISSNIARSLLARHAARTFRRFGLHDVAESPPKLLTYRPISNTPEAELR